MSEQEVQMMKRIQRKRTRGWRMPQSAKCVSRPTNFGNPFDYRHYKEDFLLNDADARHCAVDDFRRWLDGDFNWMTTSRDWILSHLDDLRGFDLACWCPLLDKNGNHMPCHADALIELIEGD